MISGARYLEEKGEGEGEHCKVMELLVQSYNSYTKSLTCNE